jgi:hypothetical protein
MERPRPGPRRGLLVAGTAAIVVVVLALGTLPTPTQVERPAPEEAAVRADARPDRERAMRSITTVPVPTATFPPGVQDVGPTGMPPAVYVAAGDLCTWERRDEAGQVLATDTGSGQTLVELRETDATFVSSEGCGWWSALNQGTPQLDEIDQGTFAVGQQLAPGRWRSDGSDLCYWERLSGLTGTLGEVLASGTTTGPVEVEVLATDVGFGSLGCGTWRRLG